MAMFAKKENNWEQKVAAEVGGSTPAPLPLKGGQPIAAHPLKYGIAETIQLMRSLPAEQNGELVVRVVRATLASLNVRLPEIIEDASRKEKFVRERIADFHAKNAELEADLKETTEVKERLQLAEGASPAPTPTPPPMPAAASVAADKIPMTTMIGTPVVR